MAALDGTNVMLHRTGSGRPLMLLHCLGVDHKFWDFVAPLAGKFALLRYDLPGHGTTPVPDRSYGIADLSAQLDVLRAEGSLASLAISLGGSSHSTSPHTIRKASIAWCSSTQLPVTPTSCARCGLSAPGPHARGVGAMVPNLLKIWFSDAYLARDPPGVRYVREVLLKTSGEGYALACEALAAADLRADVVQIRAPTLVMCGEDDIPSFLDSARWLASNIAGAKLAWLPQARHASVLESPDLAKKLLSDFLD